ncbi:MAG: thymidine phosphorylase, partial [Clostridia bacterium]
AIRLNGMTDEETFFLTDSMLHSGDIVDLSAIDGLIVDKHSTGGVGDSTTLALAPILACCGVKVAKMSGRGLGFTGGTLDKLESIPHLTTQLTDSEFINTVNSVGCAVIGQTADLVPADKKLYSLRDVTGTVDSIPLICSSIMSKKLASGSNIILLDVKYGAGAFMKTAEDAVNLAEKMVTIGTLAGKTMGALITTMEQPLSSHIGNSLEIIGIIDVLNGARNRLYEEIKEVAIRLLVLCGRTETDSEMQFEKAISSGNAKQKLIDMVNAQHGDSSYITHPEKFKLGALLGVISNESGYVSSIDTANLGLSSSLLGGGRMKKDDIIDYSVGLVMRVELGSKVEAGDLIVKMYHNGKNVAEAKRLIESSIHISPIPPQKNKIAYAYVDKNGVKKY